MQEKSKLPDPIIIPFSREDFDVLPQFFEHNPDGLSTVYPNNRLAVLNIAPISMADLRRQWERPQPPVAQPADVGPDLYTPG